jgi:heme/copper-type cytochrome/quinol oxidase subunit 2
MFTLNGKAALIMALILSGLCLSIGMTLAFFTNETDSGHGVNGYLTYYSSIHKSIYICLVFLVVVFVALFYCFVKFDKRSDAFVGAGFNELTIDIVRKTQAVTMAAISIISVSTILDIYVSSQ